MCCHNACTVLFETVLHILAARMPDHPAEYIKSPHFHTATDKVQFPEPWTLFEIPDDGQVQPNIHENKKLRCLCEKVGGLPRNAERGFI